MMLTKAVRKSSDQHMMNTLRKIPDSQRISGPVPRGRAHVQFREERIALFHGRSGKKHSRMKERVYLVPGMLGCARKLVQRSLYHDASPFFFFFFFPYLSRSSRDPPLRSSSSFAPLPDCEYNPKHRRPSTT